VGAQLQLGRSVWKEQKWMFIITLTCTKGCWSCLNSFSEPGMFDKGAGALKPDVDGTLTEPGSSFIDCTKKGVVIERSVLVFTTTYKSIWISAAAEIYRFTTIHVSLKHMVGLIDEPEIPTWDR
jgi:hypothetical protein